MTVLKICGIVLAALAGVLLLCVILPAYIAFRHAFARRKWVPFAQRYEKSTTFRVIRPQNDAAHAYVESLPHERVTVLQPREGRKSLRLSGVLYGSESEKIAVLMHGYHAHPLFPMGIFGEYLHKKGFRLLVPDERACGQSEGRYVTMGPGEGKDAVLWTEYAAALPGVQQVLLIGQSLGGAAVVFASDRIVTPKLRAIVADCPFMTPTDQLTAVCRQRHLPAKFLVPICVLMGKLLTGENFRESNADNLSRSHRPVFFLTGDADQLVPAENSRALVRLAPEGSMLFEVPGAGHALAFPLGGEAAAQALDAFLARYYSL